MSTRPPTPRWLLVFEVIGRHVTPPWLRGFGQVPRR